MGTKEGPSIPCPRAPVPRCPLSTPRLVQSRASQDTGTPRLGSLLRCAEETQDQHPRCLALATTTHKTEGRPQALPEPWPSPHPTLASPTSFFCSMAWCMSLASFFFSSSRMDGESEWSSVLGNFLPKTQAMGTVDSERLGQPGTGRNPWRQAPTGTEGALPHLSEKNGVLRGKEGRAGEQAGAGDGRDWCQCDLRCWVIGAGGQVGRWGNGWARRSQALRHSLQQLQQPLPILQPEVLGQILPLHGAQTHGGRDLTAQRPNLHSETGVAELGVVAGLSSPLLLLFRVPQRVGV